MPKRLILMRHAKSDWGSPLLDDHERPLNRRGRRSATALGNWLRVHGTLPDQALVSTSLRTRQTFDGLALGFEADLRPQLYLAAPEEILRCLQAATGDTVLLIAHNPGIGSFAQQIIVDRPETEDFRNYPTGATLVAVLPIDEWAALEPACGQLVDFAVPRRLTD